MKTFLIAFTFVFTGLAFIRAEEKSITSTSSTRSLARINTDAIQEWTRVIAKIKVDKKIPNNLFSLAEKVVTENEFQLDQMAEDLSLLMKDNDTFKNALENMWTKYPNKATLTAETQDGFESIMERAKRLMKTGQDAG